MSDLPCAQGTVVVPGVSGLRPAVSPVSGGHASAPLQMQLWAVLLGLCDTLIMVSCYVTTMGPQTPKKDPPGPLFQAPWEVASLPHFLVTEHLL